MNNLVETNIIFLNKNSTQLRAKKEGATCLYFLQPKISLIQSEGGPMDFKKIADKVKDVAEDLREKPRPREAVC